MGIATIPTYQTSDGRIFKDLDEAMVHEKGLELDGEIDAFAERNELRVRAVAVLKKYLPLFLVQREENKQEPLFSFDPGTDPGAVTTSPLSTVQTIMSSPNPAVAKNLPSSEKLADPTFFS